MTENTRCDFYAFQVEQLCLQDDETSLTYAKTRSWGNSRDVDAVSVKVYIFLNYYFQMYEAFIVLSLYHFAYQVATETIIPEGHSAKAAPCPDAVSDSRN